MRSRTSRSVAILFAACCATFPLAARSGLWSRMQEAGSAAQELVTANAADAAQRSRALLDKKAAELATATQAQAAAVANALALEAAQMKERMDRRPSAAILALLEHGDFAIGTRCSIFDSTRVAVPGAPPPYESWHSRCYANRRAVTLTADPANDAIIATGDAFGGHYDGHRVSAFALNLTVPALANASFADPGAPCFPFDCGGHFSFPLFTLGDSDYPIPGWSLKLDVVGGQQLMLGLILRTTLFLNGTLGDKAATSSLSVGIKACANVVGLKLGCTPTLPLLAFSGNGENPVVKREAVDTSEFTGGVERMVAEVASKTKSLAADAQTKLEL